MSAVLREASRVDIEAMRRVRSSVRENRLMSAAISRSEYVAAIEETGRGWVIEVDGRIVAFAVGNRRTGNIWALFVEPAYEGRGYGRKLHDAMIDRLWSQGVQRPWLTTAPYTRAARFYEAAGWIDSGRTEQGEIRFELQEPSRL